MPSRTMAPVSPQRYQSFMAGRYHRTSAVNLARSFFGEAFHPCRGSQQHLCRLLLCWYHTILAKCGIKQTDSDVATAIRTCVVLVFAGQWRAFLASIGTIGSIEPRSWLFRPLGTRYRCFVLTCYFKALGIGDVNKVVPVDKMSTVLAALIAIVLFGETSNLAVKLVGTAVITLGTFSA